MRAVAAIVPKNVRLECIVIATSRDGAMYGPPTGSGRVFDPAFHRLSVHEQGDENGENAW
jgi:hypothetical protein